MTTVGTVEELAINPLTGDLYVVGDEENVIYLIPQNSSTGMVVAGT